MQSVTFENGVVLEWDDTLSVGELITAYEKGYHILTGIDYRADDQTPLMRYTRVVTAAGKRTKANKEMVCDASYVRRLNTGDVLRLFQTEINAAIKKRDNLLDFCPR